jgi:hypothetical protein
MHITKDLIVEKTGKPKSAIPDELVDEINDIIDRKPEVGDLFMDNFLNYTNVLKNSRYSINQYLNAVKFVTAKLMGYTNVDAYAYTHPERYEKYVDALHKKGITDENEIQRAVSPYAQSVASGKLVSTMLSQVQIPTKLLNLGVLQEAINVEVNLMHNARSEQVREKAANTLIQYLGSEDMNRIEIDIGFKKDSIIEDYEKAMLMMTEQQLDVIKQGGDVKQVANAVIYEAKVSD